jgi:hypothetical protein
MSRWTIRFWWAVVDNQLALDVLHREERQPVIGGPAVKQAGNVGVFEARENLPFVPEPPHDRIGVHAALEHLHRDALLKHVVVAHAQVDGTHPTPAQLADQAVRPDPHVADQLLRGSDSRAGLVSGTHSTSIASSARRSHHRRTSGSQGLASATCRLPASNVTVSR